MKAFLRLFAFWLAFMVAAPAMAQTWTQVSDWTPSGGPVSAGAAGSTLQGGWRDISGSVWSINSSNQAISATVSGGWNNGLLLRPTSEATVDNRVRIKFVQSSTGGTAVWATLRSNGAGGSPTEYLLGISNTNGAQWGKVVSGTLTTSSASTATLTAGSTYILDAQAVQTNSTTTTLTQTVYAADGVTVISTHTWTDTTAGLQNVSGVSGLFEYISTNVSPVIELTTYSDVSAATSYTLTGPSTGVTGSPSTNFTVTPNASVSANVVVTPSDASGGGTFTPTTVTFTSGTSTAQTFTYTAATNGSKTISTSNNGGLTDPSGLTYTAGSGAATALTLTGPTTGTVGVASSNFTVATNGSLSSTVTVTPSDSGGGGTFSPTSLSLSSGTLSGAFTYTAGTSGAKTISITNTGSLTNPSGITYNASPATVVILPGTSAFLFSPGNWSCLKSRGCLSGVSYPQTWNNGAWFKVTWTASASPTATLIFPTSSTSTNVTIYLNGAQISSSTSANGSVTVTGIAPSASNTLWVFAHDSAQTARWNGATNVLQVQGLQVDGASSAGTAPAARPWALFVGDSITEGIEANNNASSFIQDYAYYVLRALDLAGYDVSINACGYSDWNKPGDSGGDVPAYYYTSGGTYNAALSRWNRIDNGVSLLDSANQISAYGATGTPPVLIYINLGTNAALSTLSTTDLGNSIVQGITALRAAAPSAKILIQMPFGMRYSGKYSQSYTTTIINAVASYKSNNPTDANVTLIDFGQDLATALQGLGTSTYYINTDYVHPNVAGHALFAPSVGQAVASALGGGLTPPPPAFRNGFH